MKKCSNCGKTHGPLKRYMWNINHGSGSKQEQGLLCDTCAKSKGAWQTQGQKDELFDDINAIIDSRTN